MREYAVVKGNLTHSAAFRNVCVALVAAVLVSGCSTVGGYQRRPETKLSRDTARDYYFGTTSEQKYKDASDADDRKRERNVVVYGRMSVIEDDFQSLERALNGTGNVISSGSDLVVLALNGIGATTGGTAAKSALAAASAGIVGAQGVVNKDLYYQSTLPALLAQMEANTENVRAQIIRNLTLSDADYPLVAANLDLKRLVMAGSIPASVSQISQQATDSKAASADAIAQTRDLIVSQSPSAVRLRNWLSPHGKLDLANIATLQAWLNKQAEPFLNGQNFPPAALEDDETANGTALEAIRQRAIAELGIPN